MKPLLFQPRQDSVGIAYARAFVGEYAIDLYPPTLPARTTEESRWLWEVYHDGMPAKATTPSEQKHRTIPVAHGYAASKPAAHAAIKAALTKLDVR